MQVSTPTIDLLVRGGTVIDGLGAEPQRADVAVSGGRIVAVGDLPEDMAAATVVDATGLTVTPGFIDVHTHTDALAFLPGHDEIHTASVRQGVTSEVCGNCGFSPFPADPAAGLDRDPYLSALGGGVEAVGEALRQRRGQRAEQVGGFALPAKAQQERRSLHPWVLGRRVAHHLFEPGQEAAVTFQGLCQVPLHC